MKYILGLALLTISSFVSYKVAYNKGFELGSLNGYSKGQVDLSLDIAKEIDEKVGKKTTSDSYYHFKDIHDITLYIYTKNGVKTVAIWDD